MRLLIRSAPQGSRKTLTISPRANVYASSYRSCLKVTQLAEKQVHSVRLGHQVGMYNRLPLRNKLLSYFEHPFTEANDGAKLEFIEL